MNNDEKIIEAKNKIKDDISSNTLKLLTIKANLSGLLANTILDYKNTIHSKKDYEHICKLIKWISNPDITTLWKEQGYREKVYNHVYYQTKKEGGVE